MPAFVQIPGLPVSGDFWPSGRKFGPSQPLPSGCGVPETPSDSFNCETPKPLFNGKLETRLTPVLEQVEKRLWRNVRQEFFW